MFNNLVSEYDRRLEEQVTLAKQDMLNELEVQIQVSQMENAVSYDFTFVARSLFNFFIRWTYK